MTLDVGAGDDWSRPKHAMIKSSANTNRFCAALLARNSDVAMIEITFRQAGFDVVDARHDLATQEMRQALREIADRAQVGPLERHVRFTLRSRRRRAKRSGPVWATSGLKRPSGELLSAL